MDVEFLSRMPPWDWPDGADETIRTTLRDRSASAAARELAAELAGRLVVMDDELADVVLELISDPDEDDGIRGRAAISLGPVLEEADLASQDDLDDASVSPETAERIRKTLRAMYTDGEAPTYVRRRVLEASVRHPEPWHEGAVRSAYHSGDHEWKVTAVFCMGHVAGFEDEILDAIRSGDPRLRHEGVVAAGRQEVRQAWPLIRPLLLAPTQDRSLLFAAIEAVVGVRPEAASAVLDPLLDSDDPDVAEAAEEAADMADAFLAGPDDAEAPGPDGFGGGPLPGPPGNGSGGRAL